MSDFEPSAPSSSTPTLYLSERVNGWWQGVSRRCSACSPAGLLRLDEPEGKYPGSLVCMTCAREPFVVRQDKPARIVPFSQLEVATRGRPLKGTPSKYAGRSGRCLDCETPIKKENTRCSTCYAAFAARNAAESNRPPCVVCGGPTVYRESSKYCGSHLAQYKRGTLALNLRAQEAGR